MEPEGFQFDSPYNHDAFICYILLCCAKKVTGRVVEGFSLSNNMK